MTASIALGMGATGTGIPVRVAADEMSVSYSGRNIRFMETFAVQYDWQPDGLEPASTARVTGRRPVSAITMDLLQTWPAWMEDDHGQ